jgi:cytochrome c556
LAALSLVCMPTPLAAEAEAAAYINYRQSVMKALGANMAAIKGLLKGHLPCVGNVAAHAHQIEIGGALIESAFEREALSASTEARPEIWKNWGKFAAFASEMTARSRKLSEATDIADPHTLAASFKALARTCGQCHRKFRNR